VIGRRAALHLALGITLTVAGVFLLAAAVGVALAARQALDGRDAMERAVLAASEANLGRARSELATGREHFCASSRRLDAPGPRLLRQTPGVGGDLRAAGALTGAACEASSGAERALAGVERLPGGAAALLPQDGRLPIESIEALEPYLAETTASMRSAEQRVRAIDPTGLHPRVAEVRDELYSRLRQGREAAEAAAGLSAVLPELLGGAGPRRYLLVAQNPAELRGTGGFMGAFSKIEIDDGRIRLDAFFSVHELQDLAVGAIDPPSPDFAARYDASGGPGFWKNLNFSPDFPTVGRALIRLYEATEELSLDGVMAVTPMALERLMALTGPVDAPGLGTIEQDQVVEVLANEAYDLFDDDATRKRALGAVALDVLQRVLGGEISGEPVDLWRALGDVVASADLMIHAEREAEQRALETAGVAGQLIDGAGQHVAVVVNNRGAQKADYYTDRTVDAAVTLHLDGSATLRLAVGLANHTPREGLPGHVIGPNVAGLEAGDNRSRVDLFLPPRATITAYRRSLGDRRLTTSRELGREVATTVIDVPSGRRGVVEVEVEVPDAWEPASGEYQLTIQDQRTIRPTVLTMSVRPPQGWQVTEAAAGAEPFDGGVRWHDVGGPVRSITLRVARP
jgi:hypothetical protein